jgi:hypothetical protein
MNSDQSLEIKAYWERRLIATQKRFQKACESLARVRKLTRPAKSKLKISSFNNIVGDHMDNYSAVMKALFGGASQATPPASGMSSPQPDNQNNNKKSKP